MRAAGGLATGGQGGRDRRRVFGFHLLGLVGLRAGAGFAKEKPGTVSPTHLGTRRFVRMGPMLL